jgi:hypothetical protein
MATVLDLHGSEPTAVPAQVLTDPTGRRARRLRRAGRLLAVVFVLWLGGLWLAGLGLLPAGDIPLGRSLVSPSPAPLRSFSPPRRAASADPAPARSPAGAPSGVHAVPSGLLRQLTLGNAGRRRAAAPAGSGHRHVPPGQGKARTRRTTAASGPPPRSANPPRGRAGGTTAPGRDTRQTTPGHTKTNPGSASTRNRGRSWTSTTTITTTSPGNSGSSRGHTATNRSGSGHGYQY